MDKRQVLNVLRNPLAKNHFYLVTNKLGNFFYGLLTEYNQMGTATFLIAQKVPGDRKFVIMPDPRSADGDPMDPITIYLADINSVSRIIDEPTPNIGRVSRDRYDDDNEQGNGKVLIVGGTKRKKYKRKSIKRKSIKRKSIKRKYIKR